MNKVMIQIYQLFFRKPYIKCIKTSKSNTVRSPKCHTRPQTSIYKVGIKKIFNTFRNDVYKSSKLNNYKGTKQKQSVPLSAKCKCFECINSF